MSRVFEEVDPAFAATCSDATLHSDKRGFFRALAAGPVELAAATGWLTTFERLPDAEKIAAVTENKEIMDGLSEAWSRIVPLHRGKDARTSSSRRCAAREALQRGDAAAALPLATQAVLRAPTAGAEEAIDGGLSLALALWQRSEVLLALDRPQAALHDLKMALKERLPARMRPQYYWRMGHCYKRNGEPVRAKVSYELAKRLLETDETAKKQLTEDLESLDYTVQPKHPPDKCGITVTRGAKQNMPALSKLVKIAEEEDKGRFAVANSAIKTGDVLLVDSPYAACLLADCYGTHCLHCFKRLEDCEDEMPMFCPNCTGVAFCSAECRDTAVATYHAYECQFLDLFIGSGMSILSYIALRMVTQAGLDTSLSIHSKYLSNDVKTVEGAVLNDVEGLGKKSKMKSRKERLNRARKGIKALNEKNAKDDDTETKEEEENSKLEDNTNFQEKLELKAAQIYALCTHSEQRKGEDYLKRIIMGMFLTECLKKGGFFKKCGPENDCKAEAAICSLVVRNLQLLQFNAHEIYETVHGEHQFRGSKPVYIAVGIYPTGALFNHECYPAVARYFEGGKLVLRATRPLSPGEVVSENYGPHFMTRGLPERQRSLASRYWFRCECRACREDWPTLKQMTSDHPPYLRCSNSSCSGKVKATPQALPTKCHKCSAPIDRDLVQLNLDTVNRCVALYQDGARLMDEERGEEAAAALCAGVDMFVEVACVPHRDTHLAQEALRSCYAARGNLHRVPTTTSPSTATSTPTTTAPPIPITTIPVTTARSQ